MYKVAPYFQTHNYQHMKPLLILALVLYILWAVREIETSYFFLQQLLSAYFVLDPKNTDEQDMVPAPSI